MCPKSRAELPHVFRTIIALASSGYLATATAARTPPLILKLLVLRETMSDLVTGYDGVLQRIGRAMPLYRCITVELGLNLQHHRE